MNPTPAAMETISGIIDECSDFMEIVEKYANAGVCLSCGEVRFGGVEPDAEEYECFECGKHAVEGLESALMYI